MKTNVNDPKTWKWSYDPETCAITYGLKGYGRCLWLKDILPKSQFLTSMVKAVVKALNDNNVHLEFVNCKMDPKFEFPTIKKVKLSK